MPFRNGEFQMTTASENNSFVKDGYLYLAPTLTSDNLGYAAIEDGYVYNITGCTFNTTHSSAYTPTHPTAPVNVSGNQAFDAAAYYRACSAVSNATAGQIINPVQSARLSTRKSASIKYGRVEVRAKIPTGYAPSGRNVFFFTTKCFGFLIAIGLVNLAVGTLFGLIYP
jgi:beta-glucanase (GH16 family)